MKRIIEDRYIAIIKMMLSQNFKGISIKDFMQHKYGLNITNAQLLSIKRMEAYSDVSPDLNDVIIKTYSSRISKEKEVIISEIKWALANNYSEEEIREVYQVTEKYLTNIKSGYMPFHSISPEYNHSIEKRITRKKHTNIDKKMVLAIKKEYVDNNGDILLQKIAEKHKIDRATVSTILSFKYYKEVGISFNSKIKSIKKKKEELIKEKKRKKIELKIEKEKLKNNSLIFEKKRIEYKLKESNTLLKKLKTSA